MLGKKFLQISFVLVILGLTSPLLAADEAPVYATRVVTVYGNVVSTKTPVDWPLAPAHELHNGDFYIMELLPEGQTVDAWQEMITIVGRKDVEGSPKGFFIAYYQAQQRICGETNVAAEILKETPDVVIGLLACGGVTAQSSGAGGLQHGQGEMGLYRIEKRDGNLYMIFKSWRGPAYDVKAADDSRWPTTRTNVIEYQRVLERSRLIEPIPR